MGEETNVAAVAAATNCSACGVALMPVKRRRGTRCRRCVSLANLDQARAARAARARATGMAGPRSEPVGGSGPIAERPAATATALKARWNAATERRFLDTLAETSNVTASARAAGLSLSSAYARRRRIARFAAAWNVALEEGYAEVEAGLLAEARHGVLRTIRRGGEEVVVREPASDRVRLGLLDKHAKRVAMIRGGAPMPMPGALATLQKAKVLEKLRGELRRHGLPDGDA